MGRLYSKYIYMLVGHFYYLKKLKLIKYIN